MALYNLARMTTATTGTGTITLGTAVSGYLTFVAAGVPNGAVVSYGIADGANCEVGTGVYGSAGGGTLARTPVTSSNSNAAINLSGNAQVFITAIAPVDFAWIVSGGNAYNNNAGNVGIGTTTPMTTLDVAGGIHSTGLTVGSDPGIDGSFIWNNSTVQMGGTLSLNTNEGNNSSDQFLVTLQSIQANAPAYGWFKGPLFLYALTNDNSTSYGGGGLTHSSNGLTIYSHIGTGNTNGYAEGIVCYCDGQGTGDGLMIGAEIGVGPNYHSNSSHADATTSASNAAHTAIWIGNSGTVPGSWVLDVGLTGISGGGWNNGISIRDIVAGGMGLYLSGVVDANIAMQGDGGSLYWIIAQSPANGDRFLIGGSGAAESYGAITIGSTGDVNFPSIGTSASAANAYLNSSNNLSKTSSSLRYKKDIEPISAEEAYRILQLRPVKYRSKSEIDDPYAVWYGMIAEEVAEVDPRLVHFDKDGRPDGVQYDRLAVLLLALIQRREQCKI